MKELERETKEGIPFTIAKRIKYLGVYLPKEKKKKRPKHKSTKH